MLRFLLLAWLSAAPSAALVLAPAAQSYTKLQGVELLRASDGAACELTSLWRPGILGLGGERATVFFMRHFG